MRPNVTFRELVVGVLALVALASVMFPLWNLAGVAHDASVRAVENERNFRVEEDQPTERPGLRFQPTRVIVETRCTFVGQSRLSCESTRDDGTTTTTNYPYPLTDDAYEELRYSLVSAWFSPEPGRERFLTPQELTEDEWLKPSSPTRRCPDGDHAPWSTCPDLSVGEVRWSHEDGTTVTLPREWWDPEVWKSQRQPDGKWAPSPRRCPGSEHWLPYVPSCEVLRGSKW